jgi:membrane protein implicated in regulation of membrane protease activity
MLRSLFRASTPKQEHPRATVAETIAPRDRGRVYFRGSWWFAQCDRPIIITPGTAVAIVGRRNITLVVEPDE